LALATDWAFITSQGICQQKIRTQKITQKSGQGESRGISYQLGIQPETLVEVFLRPVGVTLKQPGQSSVFVCLGKDWREFDGRIVVGDAAAQVPSVQPRLAPIALCFRESEIDFDGFAAQATTAGAVIVRNPAITSMRNARSSTCQEFMDLLPSRAEPCEGGDRRH